MLETTLIRACGGDTVAQDRLREVLHPRLQSLARHYAARTRMDVADLTQEAWVAVFVALPTLDPTIGMPVQYLLKHARWQIIDHIRWNKRRSHEPLEDLLVETPEIAKNAFCTSVSRLPSVADVETRLLIADLERRLNIQQRQILLGLLEGDTWRQIGERLGCSSANIAYHIRVIRLAYTELVTASSHVPIITMRRRESARITKSLI